MKIKNFALTSTLGYISAVATLVPMHIYYGLFFKETINGQSAEVLEGIIMIAILYIPIILFLSLIIQVAQTFTKKQLSNKVTVFIFIGVATLFNLTIEFSGLKPSVILIVTTFVLYSTYYLLSSSLKTKKK